MLLTMPQAAPTPVLGSSDQVGAQGIALDIAANRQKMVILLDRKGFESALVERPGARRAIYV